MESSGLYIHVPFCVRKCHYCDFLSYRYDTELAEGYLLALFSELELLSLRYNQPELKTIYLGGGTPTCLRGRELVQILARIKTCFSLDSETAEITCEVNPATVREEDLQQMREAGFNRLSIGVQSFHTNVLQYLGRLHDVEAVFTTYQLARKVGFQNINLDLIFAIPQQTKEDWVHSLQAALALEPEHLSLYNLKIEEGTPFHRDYNEGKLVPVDEETDLWMYETAITRLHTAGLRQYEISNFARPGFESRHNLRYWHYEPFLAAGPGAHGFDGHLRYANRGQLTDYIHTIAQRELPWEEVHHLSLKDQMEEFMMMGLRLMEGVSLQEFERRFHCDLREVYSLQVSKLSRLGLLRLAGDHLALTKAGIPLGNAVFTEFLL